MILAACIAAILAAGTQEADERPADAQVLPFYVFDPAPVAWGPSVGALDRDSGRLLWKRTFISEQSSLYLFQSKSSVATGINGRMIWLDAVSGETRMELEGGGVPVSAGGRNIFPTNQFSETPVRAYDENGKLLWSRPEIQRCVAVASPDRPLAVLTLPDLHLAVDSITGKELWRRLRSKADQWESVDGHFLTSIPLKHYVVDVSLDTGKDARILEVPDSIISLRRIGSQIVIQGQDSVYGIDLRSFSVAWTWSAPGLLYTVGGNASTLLASTHSGIWAILDARSGREIRRILPPSTDHWASVLSPRGVLACEPFHGGGLTTVYRTTTGDALWEGTGHCRPADEAGLFLIVQDLELRGIDLQTGIERWRVMLPETAYAAQAEKDRIFLLGPRFAAALDAATGKEQWRTEIAKQGSYMDFSWPWWN